MNIKKFWIAFVVVFIVLEILGYIVHGVMLASTYESEGIKEVFRSMEEMDSKMWIMWLTDLIWAYLYPWYSLIKIMLFYQFPTGLPCNGLSMALLFR